MDIKFLVRFETYNSVLVQVSFQYTLLYILLKVQYGPQRCHGIGLSDGETMERLWSYLRRFNRMTKEMRPSHRVDVLTSALTYYGIKTKDKLSEFNLPFRVHLTNWNHIISTPTLDAMGSSSENQVAFRRNADRTNA